MPRVKLDRFITSIPVKSIPSVQDVIQLPIAEPIVADLAPAIDVPVKPTLKRLAGTAFLIDVDTGLVYLEPSILKALKNS